MENSSKSYQVAYSYQEYVKNATTRAKKEIMSLPSSIPEEEDSTRQIAQPKLDNIFRNSEQSKGKKIDAIPAKAYQCVGMKQVQAFVSKTDKKKRRINSLLKRTSQSVLSYSRASQTKISDKYMTKDDVIRLYGKGNHKHSVSHLQQMYISDENKILTKTFSTQNTTIGSSLFSPSQTSRNLHNHDFSMSKLKQKINNYKGEWQRQLSKKKLKASHNRYNSVKLDSILKDSESFRMKMQRLELISITESNENLQPKMWTLMLRNSKPIQKPLIVQKVLQTGLECHGKSKLSKEINWVQEKDRLGFYFKGRKQAKENILL